jgi:hypothetical protein
MTDHEHDDHDHDREDDELNGELPEDSGLDLPPGDPADLDPQEDVPDGLDIDLGVEGSVSTPTAPPTNGEEPTGRDGEGAADELPPEVDSVSYETVGESLPADEGESLLRAPAGDDAPDVDVTDEVRVPARYQAIHEARQAAAEAFRDLSQRRLQAVDAARGLPPEDREGFVDRLVESYLRDTVRAYVIEVEPLMTRVEVGDWYWNDLPLGTIEFGQLELRVEEDAPGLNRGRGVDVDQTRHPEPVEIVGLRDFVTSPDEFSRSLTVEVEPTGTGYGTREEVVSETVVMPTEISREAFRAANSFVADVGLDLSAEQVTGGGFDYSDIA